MQFVIRYHSRTTKQPQKRLSPREAAELARAGLFLATVYQDNARKLSDFGAERGAQDAESALVYAGQVGQPAGSAVYFAVDWDFSGRDIETAVVPYFQSVARAFAAAGHGTPYLTVGVYGSGLTCRLIRQLPFVRFSWLAESTGWRESRDYRDWDVKQHRNDGETLCSLENRFERCEARDDFGQFKPVGFDVRAGEGQGVKTLEEGASLAWLPANLRLPHVAFVPGRQPLHVLGAARPQWLRVRTSLGGSDVIGYIHESNLDPVSPGEAVPVAGKGEPAQEPAIPAAHLTENVAGSARASPGKQAFPLGEPSRKTRDSASSAAERVTQMRALADWLSVESSARYAPRPPSTFCNVYAADYAYLCGVYLPRVWWSDSALVRLGRGEHVSVEYGKTVRELKADDLFAWLVDIGPQFGWRRVFDATALQDAANAGGLGMICADRAAKGRSGHITVVVPEDNAHKAIRDADGHVTQPLQSQAGSSNHRYGSAGPDWWQGSKFKDRGFFVHG